MYRISENSAEALEFKVKEKHENLTGIPLKDLKFKEGILICGILRNRTVISNNVKTADGSFYDPSIIYENKGSITYSRTNIID